MDDDTRPGEPDADRADVAKQLENTPLAAYLDTRARRRKRKADRVHYRAAVSARQRFPQR